jgi:sugar phosphate isomerase/epimerase
MGSSAVDSYEPHPDNLGQKGFDAFVEAARDIIDGVKPKRAKLCFEMMQWELPDNPEVLVELIKAIDRPAFAAHLDPCNLVVSPHIYYDTTSLIKKCFELLGPWIISAHAKDLTIRYQLSFHLDEVILGTGNLDYRTYVKMLDGRGIPILLEHLEHPQYPQARDYIKGVGRDVGVDI